MTRLNTQTRAAVFRTANQPLDLVELPAPNLHPGEALVRVSCCTICGSDLHTYHGRRESPTPTILGHEIIGFVEANEGASDIAGVELQIGDRVTWSVAVSCNECARCKAAMPQKCLSLFKYGHEKLDSAAHGPTGGMTEHVHLKAGTAVVRLSEKAPAEVPDEVLCPANCATATVAAAVRVAGSLEYKRVLIVGAGMLGLTTSAFARKMKAEEVCVCEADYARMEPIHDFGATRISDQIPKDKFDVVFEMSGNTAAVQQAVNSLDVGGRLILVGSVCPTPDVAINPESLVRGLNSIHGVHNYRPDDLSTAIQFLSEHHTEFPFATLVEKSFSLDEANEAIRYATEKKPIRVAIKPCHE